MGTGFLKRKKLLKEHFLNQVLKDNERLRAENKALKEDPNGVVAPFLKQLNELAQQNNRLSALSCALIKTFGDVKVDEKGKDSSHAAIQKSIIDGFQKHRLTIMLAVDEEKDPDNYTFTYTATPLAEIQKQEEAAMIADAAAAVNGTAPAEEAPADPILDACSSCEGECTAPVAVTGTEDVEPSPDAIAEAIAPAATE